jgi:hypothetical protein
MNILEQFMKGMDVHQPDWFIIYANELEMQDHIRRVTDGRSGTVLARTVLRREVANRLIEVVRAAMSCGLVEYVLPKPTDTDATIDLVEQERERQALGD